MRGPLMMMRGKPVGESFADDFNRADNPTDLGPNWDIVTGSFGILSERARTQTTSNLCVWATQSATDDNFSQAAFAQIVNSSGVICRWTGATTTGYLWRYNGSETQILRAINGSFSAIGNPYPGPGAQSAAVFRIEAVGDTITGYIDGIERQQTVDNEILTGRQLGVRLSTANRYFDDWSGGDL